MSDYNQGKHVFAIWGGPGGGKTTLAVNMATVLADSGYMTCLVSGTDHGELQAFFGTAIPKGKGLYAAISNGRNVRESLTEARPNLFLLELDTGGDSFDIANITAGQVQHMLTDLRDQFTYVIIDCTNHKESTFTGMGLAEADKCIICIPHRVSAATWHISNSQILEPIAEKTLYVDVDTREGGCNMSQLLTSIDLPECDLKVPCVDTAYLCENTSNPIVLMSGKQERKYKKAVLNIVQYILEVDKEERAEQARAQQAYNEGNTAPAPKKKKFSFHPTDGIKKKKMSKRAIRKAEEEAIRKAQQEAMQDSEDIE